MKFKNLLFILFILYWVIVYGVSFFVPIKEKSKFQHIIPAGYYMYVNTNHTYLNARYEFFLNGEKVKDVTLSNYFEAERENPLFLINKRIWAKEKMYFQGLFNFDYGYQNNLYRNNHGMSNFSFKEEIAKNPKLKTIDKNIKNFTKLYLMENPVVIADSVNISIGRSPMILPFAPEYRDNFTHFAGEGVFYNISQKL